MADTKAKAQEPGTRATNAVTRPAARAADVAPPHPRHDFKGMPEGYKPDTSVQFVAGKDGKPDMLKNDDGTTAAVSPTSATSAPVLEELPEKHTYRDRVESQAKSLGIEIDPEWTLEYLLWVIRMKASS